MTVLRDLTRFKQPTSPEAFPEYHEVVQELDAGQQFKVIVVKTHSFRYILLHAYVPDNGYPVVLSFVGQEAQATNVEMLLQHL